MPIETGTRLGPYEVVGPLGAGGMGEVFRARDTRLGRSVAIKVLPTGLAADPELRARLEREAKTISALSHPHICALYDVGSQDGVDYLVMELLEGETLAERLSRGALPADLVLRYGIQIADALDKAHRQGVVHRDLKPGNVMLTKSGVKLLDFGLAKQRPGASDPVASYLPTRVASRPLTERGTILGTFQYMSPEQLEGKEADARSDLFALGAVLYEMATGRKAFTGTSQASLIAAILAADPPAISSIQRMAPPALDRLVKTCLAKDPDDRWESAHDVRLELIGIAESPGAAAPRPARRRGIAAACLAAALAGAAVGLLARPAARAPRALRVSLTLPLTSEFVPTGSLAISPDGGRIAFLARALSGEGRQLYVQSLDRFEPTPLAGTEGAFSPFFSPDGRWIGYAVPERIWKVPADGGATVPVCDYPGDLMLGAAWDADDTIYFERRGMWKVPGSGGTPTRVVDPDPAKGERFFLWPALVPGRRKVLYTAYRGGRMETASTMLWDLAKGRASVVLPNATDARYLPTGHLLFVRSGALFAAPFDPDAGVVTGTAVPAVDGVMTGVANGEAHLGVSREGTLVYRPGGPIQEQKRLVFTNREGKEEPATSRTGPFAEIRLSPDGKRLALVVQSATFDVWILDLERDTLGRVSFGEDDGSPLFSPDGKRLVYGSTRAGGPPNLYWRPADATGEEERLTTSAHQQSADCFTPAGDAILFDERDPETREDLWVLPLGGDRKARPLLRTPFRESHARFSPDGRFLAYASDASGRAEVYVQPYPALDRKWQVSLQGGELPHWSPDGRELFYKQDQTVMSVAVKTVPGFEAGAPKALFRAPGRGRYEVTPDGRRFVFVVPARVEERVRVNVVLDWFAELRRRVAGARERP